MVCSPADSIWTQILFLDHHWAPYRWTLLVECAGKRTSGELPADFETSAGCLDNGCFRFQCLSVRTRTPVVCPPASPLLAGSVRSFREGQRVACFSQDPALHGHRIANALRISNWRQPSPFCPSLTRHRGHDLLG